MQRGSNMGGHAVVFGLEPGHKGRVGVPRLGPGHLVAFQQLKRQPPGGVASFQQTGVLNLLPHGRQHRIKVRPVGNGQSLSPFLSMPQFHGGGQRLVQPLAGTGHGFHHGHAQAFGQACDIDVHARRAGFVHHVQGQHHGQPQFEKLYGKKQVAFQGRGVDHVDDRKGRPFGQLPADHDFLFGIGGQRIGAGQVHKPDRLAVQMGRALFAFHRNAGVVAHMLARAGIGVERRGLARIGVARQSHVSATGHVADGGARVMRVGLGGYFFGGLSHLSIPPP